ncbi:conserved hypothetical protein [Sporisorium reilianum SRZ2]|uniref:Amine oxidase domain-containing protein n=1 Tax=Sporisorium reilianum (strain SRZ2) TaxID=999809 RepID=E6ZQX2_SPORE|nr:conserved hypothetical protein [Sporisorium reilianum SRZ2]
MSIPGSPPREVRVAIVGSGLTGLVATYLLTAPASDSANGVKVTVDIFERASTLGMDSASISVPLPPDAPSSASTQRTASSCISGGYDKDTLRPRSHKRLKLETHALADAGSTPQRSMRIDVPMRAFTGGYYPQLLALYRHLGIRIKKTNFTYSFAALPPCTAAAAPSPATLSSPSFTASSSGTRPSSPQSDSTAAAVATSIWPAPINEKEAQSVQAPSPSILYNGANGVRGVSLPADLRQPRLSSPVRLSSILDQVSRIRVYFASLLLLVLGYLQLLVIALWHHHTVHTCDAAHPLRTHTLADLVTEPFPARSSSSSSRSLRSRLGLAVERVVEHALRRTVCLDERFAQQTLTPLFSAVMTSSLDSVWSCPASEVLDYVALTLGKDHFVVKDGVRTVVATLLKHVDPQQTQAQPPAPTSRSRVWTSAEVRRVQSRAGRAWIDVVHHDREASPRSDSADTQDMSRAPSSTSTDRTLCNDADQQQQHGPFDHVIFATQANQTARFLEQYVESLAMHDGSGEEEEEVARLGRVIDVLSMFKYERSVVVNHTDRALLPRDRADWRDLNLVSPSQRRGGAKQAWVGRRRGSADSDWTDENGDATDASASNDTLWSLSGGATSHTQMKAAGAYTMATHVLALPPPATQSDLLVMQTTNPLPTLHPRPATVLSRSTFERAVIDVDAHLARSLLFHFSQDGKLKTAGGRTLALGSLQQQKRARVWVCGSWAVGIPLLEGCVVSARLVAEEIMRREGVEVSTDARW